MPDVFFERCEVDLGMCRGVIISTELARAKMRLSITKEGSAFKGAKQADRLIYGLVIH